MGQRQSNQGSFWNLLIITLIATTLWSCTFGAVVRRKTKFDFGANIANSSISSQNATIPALNNNSTRLPSGDFPVCTDSHGPFVPFCLPEDGADILVDTTYYVTWNADFYPLNATITIELRYSESPEGSSAFTSERTDNSYGYIPLHMQKDWLQGKPNNTLTLYIIELDPTLDRRANARQGPTIMLRPKPVKHYKPSPPEPFNKLALYIGLPVSVGIVFVVVASMVFGMSKSRRIAMQKIRRFHKGYGIGQSKTERLGGLREESSDSHGSTDLNKYPDDLQTGLLEGTGSNKYNRNLEHSASYAFSRDVSKLKSWAV